MDYELIEYLFEDYNYDVTTMLSECNDLCTDAIITVNHAFEMCELCDIAKIDAVITESSSTGEVISLQEGAIGDFFQKIWEMLKSLAGKIRDLARKIKDKFIDLFGGGGFKSANTPDPVKWPNGYKIDVSGGYSTCIDFTTELAQTVNKYSDVFNKVIKCLMNKDMDGAEESYPKDVKSPIDMLKSKMKKGGGSNLSINDAMSQWLDAAFKYEQMGDDYEIPHSEAVKLANDLVKFINEKHQQKLADILMDIAKMADNSANNIKQMMNSGSFNSAEVKFIQGSFNVLMTYSTFAMQFSGHAYQYIGRRFTPLINVLRKAKYIVVY